MSAHVVSKAKPYPAAADDDASTAIAGGQWEEEEASTTIEHGQVANKLAPLPPTKPGAPSPALLHNGNGNITQTGAGLDDHTVDDQHAREVLSAITPIRPEAVARLFVTAGNDSGREVEIQPGKTYTIGRGIDNDVVLTDISVSRKHFDLKHEDGAWVIVDRGSGNGTVVNGNLEDNPFMLATGDVIEIGNTVFRFDQPNGAPRESASTYDLEDEELSTVAGKPVREEDALPLPQRRTGARSAPPLPAPLPIAPLAPVPPMRPMPASQPPPLSQFAAQAQAPFAATMGPPQPASTMPMAQMANRAPLVGPGAQTMMGDAMGMPMHGQPGPQMLGQTLQGQQPARASYPYPQAMEIPPHSVHAQMLIQQSGARRGDGSTAHVAPVPYNPMPMGMPPRGYGAPGISRRTKLLIGGVALAVLTGVVTAAIVKSGEKPKAAASAKADKGSVKAATPDPKTSVKPTTTAKSTQKPTVEPIKDTPKQEPKVATVTAPVQTGQPVTTQNKVVTAEPPKIAPKVEPEKDKVVKQETRSEPKRESRDKQETRSEPKRESRDKRRESRPSTPPKRVAAAVDSDAAEEKADSLYRSRNFNGAAKVLADAAKKVDEDEAKQLRLKSEKYLQLGKTYAKGTAPAAKPNVAYEFLQQASNYDRNLGNAFDDDIQQKLAAVAPKAAIAWFAQQQYAKARSALITAQRLGSTDSNLPIVKQKLEGVARELYEEAAKEMSSNPTSAKEKLRQVKSYVDAKSQWAVKAEALLKKS